MCSKPSTRKTKLKGEMNMIVVPLIIKYGYGVPMPLYLSALAVGAGQVISCYGLGFILIQVLEKYTKQIFVKNT